MDKDFDDVERILPIEKDSDYRPKVELSMEKSTVGLGEEYAKDYEQKFLGRTREEVSKRTEEIKELDEMFVELCGKLDSLSNFHYTPKALNSVGQIVPVSSDVAAVRMEEAIPVTESIATQAAPEDIMAVPKGFHSLGKDRREMTQQERNGVRRSSKAVKRARKRMRDAESKIVSKLNPGLGNKHAKTKLNSELSNKVDWTKSTQVFRHLQDSQQNPGKALTKTLKVAENHNQSSMALNKSAAIFKL